MIQTAACVLKQQILMLVDLTLQTNLYKADIDAAPLLSVCCGSMSVVIFVLPVI